jgi:hypothetical protein
MMNRVVEPARARRANGAEPQAATIEQWLGSVPMCGDGEVTANVPIALPMSTWAMLAAVASKKKMRVPELIAELIEDNDLFEDFSA